MQPRVHAGLSLLWRTFLAQEGRPPRSVFELLPAHIREAIAALLMQALPWEGVWTEEPTPADEDAVSAVCDLETVSWQLHGSAIRLRSRVVPRPDLSMRYDLSLHICTDRDDMPRYGVCCAWWWEKFLKGRKRRDWIVRKRAMRTLCTWLVSGD